jgi:hypothetical protein
MFYVITKAGSDGPPTFVLDDDDKPAAFSTENEAHEGVEQQPLCEAYGYTILHFNEKDGNGETELMDSWID